MVSTILLTSCKKNNNDTNDTTSGIVGTWTCSNHWYGGPDTYVFKSNGKYQWSGPFSSESGDYSFNGAMLTTSSSTSVTRVFTIISLTDTYFVMMDQEASSYTYYKDGYSPGNGGGNNGGNNGGGNNGNEIPNPLDFEFAIGFDPYIYAFDEGHGTYERCFDIAFATPVGLYSRGITEFAIGIQNLDGSIFYKQGLNCGDHNVYEKKEGDVVWYTGTLYNDLDYTWAPLVTFEHMSSPTLKFKWTYRVKCNGSYYGGDRWTTEEYPGEIGSNFK